MKFAPMIGSLVLAASAACASPVKTSSLSPCTATDSVSGTPVPCYSADSVSGTPALNVMLTAAGQTVPFSAVTARCSNTVTGSEVRCGLAVTTGTALPAPAPAPAPMMSRGDSVSGTPDR